MISASGATPTRVLDSVWAILFPARCLGCKRRGAPLCEGCEGAVPWLGRGTCPRCARTSTLGRACVGCGTELGALDGVRAACAFEGVARQAVQDLKYRQGRYLAELAAGWLARSLEARPVAADLLVPVPLAEARRRGRGYNQSELIAERLGRAIGVPMRASVLRRVRETPPQVGRSAVERRENVDGAFACPEPGLVAGRRVALIDDVATTCSTLRACAEPLKMAGAGRVYGLVVARAG